jgi:hypothetical protein
MELGSIFLANVFEDQAVYIPPRLITIKEMKQELGVMLEHVVMVLTIDKEAINGFDYSTTCLDFHCSQIKGFSG